MDQAMRCWRASRYLRLTLLNLAARRFMNSSATELNTSFSSPTSSWNPSEISTSQRSAALRALATQRMTAQLSREGLSRQKLYSTRERSSRQRHSSLFSACSPANCRYSSSSQQLVTAFTLKLSASRISLSIARICSGENCPPPTLKQALRRGVLTSSNLAATKRAARPSSWYLPLETYRLWQYLSTMSVARKSECWPSPSCGCASTSHPTSPSRSPAEMSECQDMKSSLMKLPCSWLRVWLWISSMQGVTSSPISHCPLSERLRLPFPFRNSLSCYSEQLVMLTPNSLAELRVCICRPSLILIFQKLTAIYSIQAIRRQGRQSCELPLIIFKLKMKGRSAKESHSAKSAGSKQQREQSTTVFQSKSSILHFPSRLHNKPHPNPKFYNCCNTTHSQQLHFHPEVHTLPFTLYPYSNALAKSKREQWETLTQDNRSKTQRRTEARLREEEERLRQCTFTPFVSQFAPSDRAQPIHNRLYEEAQKKRAEQLEQEKQKRERERREAQFFHNAKPDTQKWKILNKQKFDLEPLYKRLEKVIQDKKKSRKMVAEKEEVAYPFHPQVSEASKKLAKKRLIENVVDRLIEDYKKKEERMDVLRQNLQATFKKEFPFAPAINNYLPTDHIRIHRNNYQQDYSFTPAINPISSLMMQDRQHETHEEKMFRLCTASLVKKADNIAQIEAEAYAECYFNPEINEISKQMNLCGHKHHLCEVKEPESPTYRPQINEVSRTMSSSKRAKSLDNIKKKKQEKEAGYKKEAQYLQMKECSFKPRIKDNKSERKVISHQRSIQQVAGFKRFYENVEKAQQKERERKDIEERLFHLERSYDLRMQKLGQKRVGEDGGDLYFNAL